MHKGEQKNETSVEGHVVDYADIKSGSDNVLGNKADRAGEGKNGEERRNYIPSEGIGTH